MNAAAAGAVVMALALVPMAGVADAAQQEVSIQFEAFAPSQLDILSGETVQWTNVSERTHTVTSDTGLFDSGEVPGGARFTLRPDAVGSYAYHCTIHPTMHGEIDVRRVILGPLPAAPVPVGAPIELTGRSADPTQPVVIERSLDGVRFSAIAMALPAADGTWRTTVDARVTADYRAASASGVSQTRRLLVSTRRIRIVPTRRGVHVVVTPSSPGARLLVESYLRERFGWWPVARTRADFVSEADVRISRPARVRVILVDRDGWTPLATSRILSLRRPRSSARAPTAQQRPLAAAPR